MSIFAELREPRAVADMVPRTMFLRESENCLMAFATLRSMGFCSVGIARVDRRFIISWLSLWQIDGETFLEDVAFEIKR